MRQIQVAPLKTYHVKIVAPATPANPEEVVVVRYQESDYKNAWVGARTVCRMGTNERRVFKVNDEKPFADAELFSCRAGVYTVKNIFVADTRKRGKQRMTTLSSADLLRLLDEHAPATTDDLREALRKVADDAGGVRITTASARRLGLTEEG